jgi:hypothetical protein
MKPPRQFLPLLKNALDIYRLGPLPVLAFIGIMPAVLFSMGSFSPELWMEDHQDGWGSGQAFFIYILSIWLLVTCMPIRLELAHGIPTSLKMEFLFTRAIDRKYLCRAQMAAGVILVQGPLIINLLLSPLKPDLVFDRKTSTAPAAANAQKRYEAVFPGSFRTVAPTGGPPGSLVVRHGAAMFAAETVAATLVGGYHALVIKRTQRAALHNALATWLQWLVVLAPMIIGIGLTVVCGLNRINLFEESFLRFAAHPWLLMALALAARYGVLLPILEWRTTQYEYV